MNEVNSDNPYTLIPLYPYTLSYTLIPFYACSKKLQIWDEDALHGRRMATKMYTKYFAGAIRLNAGHIRPNMKFLLDVYFDCNSTLRPSWIR